MINTLGTTGKANFFHRNTKWLKAIKRFEILRMATQHLVNLWSLSHYVLL